MTSHPPLKEPPPAALAVGIVGAIGLIFVLISLLFGLGLGDTSPENPTKSFSGLRGLITFVGLIIAAGAVTLRPTHPLGYAFFALGCLFAMGVGNKNYWIGGFSNHWDSLQFLAKLFLIGGCFGFVWTLIPTLRDFFQAKQLDARHTTTSPTNGNGLMPAKVIAFAVLAWVFFHITTIYGAMTNPEPSPWVNQQLYGRFARPYHTTLYMGNAYQFYSPNPGDSSQLWFCIEYGPPDPKDDILVPKDQPKDVRWILFPTRRKDYVDPLGLTYVRRLAYTEQAIQTVPPGSISYSEASFKAVYDRRIAASVQKGYTAEGSPIPMISTVAAQMQFLLPMDHVRWQILPSYARHLSTRYAVEGKRIKSVKIYRATHRMLTMQEYHGYPKGLAVASGRGGYVSGNPSAELIRVDPYDPTTYNIYFLGEFAETGDQINIDDALLYWQIPILAKKTSLDFGKDVNNDNYEEFYADFVNIHAGSSRLQGGKP